MNKSMLLSALAIQSLMVYAFPATGQVVLPENITVQARFNLKQFCPNPVPSNYDYAPAFQQGLRTLYDNGGGVLEVDPGTYKVCQEIALVPEVANNSGSFNSAIHIRGSGGRMESTRITCPEALPTGSRAFFVFDGRNSAQYSVTIENLLIEGDPGRWAWANIAGIRSINREAVFLKDVMFRNLLDGFSMYSGQPYVELSKFSQIGRYAIDISKAGDGAVSKCEFASIGCDIQSSGLCSAQFWASAAIYAGGDQVIADNVIGSNFGAGVRVSELRGGELDVVHNQFDNNSRIMIFDEKSNQNPPGQPAEYHVSTNILVEGNKIQGYDGGPYNIPGYTSSMRKNPQLGYIQGNLIGSLKVVNNRFSGLAANSIGFEIDNGEDILIQGNSFSDLYSFTRQKILGKLFHVSNTVKFNLSDNSIHVGEAGTLRDFAYLNNVRGMLTGNMFSGYSNGLVKAGSTTSSTALQCRDNIGWKKPGERDDATNFNDASGCFVKR